jgi:hypothetical protein
MKTIHYYISALPITSVIHKKWIALNPHNSLAYLPTENTPLKKSNKHKRPILNIRDKRRQCLTQIANAAPGLSPPRKHITHTNTTTN